MNNNDDTIREIVGQYFVYTEPATDHSEKTFSQVPEVFMIYGKHLTLRAKWVYTTLRKYYNKTDKRCFPSLPTISELSGLSVKTVSKALDELQTFGWILRRPINSKYVANGQPMIQNDMLHPVKSDFGYTTMDFRLSPTKEQAAEYRKKKKPTAFIKSKLELGLYDELHEESEEDQTGKYSDDDLDEAPW